MRGKRSKQYRKLMEQYSMTFGFREPYQVLGKSPSPSSVVAQSLTRTVDAEMVKDSCRFKMELAPALQRTVHGKVKPSKYAPRPRTPSTNMVDLTAVCSSDHTM